MDLQVTFIERKHLRLEKQAKIYLRTQWIKAFANL